MTSAVTILADWFSENEALTQSALASVLLAFSIMVALRVGMFSFAGVGFWAVGGYTAAVLVQHGWPTVAAVAAAIVLAAALSLLIGLVLGRLRAVYMAMATFAFVMIVRVVAVSWEDVTGGTTGLYAIPNTVTTLGVAIVAAVAAVVVALLDRGALGRSLAAVRTDETLAAANGVDVVRHRIGVFVLSGIFGAVSGAMNALLFNTLNPDQGGFPLILDAMTMVVLGGTGAWWGPVVGAFVVVWLPDILAFAGDWRAVVQGALIVLVVVYVPGGIVAVVKGVVGQAVRLVRRREAPA